MNGSGISRKLDSLGRVVIPVEARCFLSWEHAAAIEFYIFGRYLLLRKQVDTESEPVCMRKESPLLTDFTHALVGLTDDDLLLLLELAQRLKHK